MSIDELPPRTEGNVLYALSADPHEALAQLEAKHGFTVDPVRARRGLLDDIERVLRDPAVASDVTLRIAGAHDASGDPDVHGPLGLYLGLNAATALAACETPEPAVLEAARGWLAQEDVIACLYEFYELDPELVSLRAEEAELHTVGTTSIIFRCPRTGDLPARVPLLALKCLLPRYFGVQAIRDRTNDYANEHLFTRLRAFKDDSVPIVHRSSDKTIVMDFVEGDTLAQVLGKRAEEDARALEQVPEDTRREALARRRALDGEDIAFIRNMLAALCDVLGRLYDLDRSHLDLSPSNIIIRSIGSERIELTLIDFGHNFAVTERVGSSAAIRRAGLYVAPELLEDPTRVRETSRTGWRCDAYSLGVILLEMAARRRLAHDELTTELERLWQGDGEWSGALGLARIVEELTDARPEHRLLLIGEADEPVADDAGANPYRYLGELVRQETEVQSLYEEHSAGVGFGLLKGYAVFKLHGNVQLRNLLEAGRAVSDPVDDTYRDYPGLARWTRVALYSWFLVLTSFVTLTAADLHLYVFEPAVEAMQRALDPPFMVGAFWDNLPGRLVALTFALTQVTYYVNNYAVVSPRRLGSKLGRASELVLRANTILLTIPVMWAMVWQPTAWPLCSGLGTLLVVVNNYLTLQIARRANQVGGHRGFSTLGEGSRKFVEDMYSEWWMLMGLYSLSLIAIGILLDAGAVNDNDARVFAALVVLINVAKMYRLNCVRFAPQVRGCLSRAILTLRRSDRLGTMPDARATVSGMPASLRTVLTAWRGGLDAAERT